MLISSLAAKMLDEAERPLSKKGRGNRSDPRPIHCPRWLNELPSGTVYQLTLKKLMFTDPNNIAGLMARMERMGLIERRADVADRRKSSSFCTSKGKNLFELWQGKLRSGLRKRRWPFSPNQKEKSFSDCRPRSIGVFIPNDRGIASHLQANPFSPAASAVHSAIGISGGSNSPSRRELETWPILETCSDLRQQSRVHPDRSE